MQNYLSIYGLSSINANIFSIKKQFAQGNVNTVQYNAC